MPSISDLKANFDRLSDKDKGFAGSLLQQAENGRALSSKQLYWVDVLAQRAIDGGKPAVEPVAIGDLGGLLALFDKAQQKLKNPAIVLHVEGVGEVRINVAGPYARQPGTINVAENKGYGESEWFGRIQRDGAFEPSKKVSLPEQLVPALREFANDPAGVAARHGQLTGKCCFCNTTLTDERSTLQGYGPVCAKNYGLAWGAKPRTADLFCT